ncbi:protein phosphatase CheZ [Oxalobacteraceae bacterium CAVE-383]|nr:protein phosphatase CheZ [Oxalobacteraceae bacterium CAVE-383]
MEDNQPQAAAGTAAAPAQNDEFLTRIGQMTRSLHDNLRGLGFDRLLEKAASDMPDARDRLEYVAQMTEKAAQRVLNATELALPLQDGIQEKAAQLGKQWEALLAAPFAEADYRALAAQSIVALQQTQDQAVLTRSQLMDIMMAQDFQDLTGQVIKRVTELANDIERQLVQLLVDYAPSEVKREDNGLMNGPQIHAGGKDVIADQSQVDDLLESLGF